MRPAEVVRRAADYLERHGVDQPLPTAETLLASVLATTRVGLYTREEGLSSSEARTFGRALCRRCTGTPVQYLTGEQGFRRLTLRVRPGVFIPRPETEVVAHHALEAIEGMRSPVVVDLGTGAGTLALAIVDERPDARVLATDLSPDAVDLARENARQLGLHIEVHAGDLLDPLPDELRGHVDLVVSNPPYVDPAERDRLPAETLADPPLALFGGRSVYEAIFAGAVSWLRASGAVVVEIEETMGAALAAAAADAGLERVLVCPDLTGRDRVLVARRP